MELTAQLRVDLNELQKKIMDEWKRKTSKRLGVSIQTDQQIQDHNESHTRTQPTNSYCKHWIESNAHVAKCDRLDIELKEELNKRNDMASTTGLACRCHKGVSNFVHKIELYNTTWYIYYGQFILTGFRLPESVINNHGVNNFSVFSNEITKDKLKQNGFEYYSPSKSSYIKKNPLTKRNDLIGNFPRSFKDVDEKISDIAEIDLVDFFAFKEFVEHKLIHFLNVWHKKDKDVLTDFVEENKEPLVVLLTKFESSLEVQKEVKRTDFGNGFSTETIKVLQEIIELIKKISANTKIAVKEEDIKLINDFAELEDNGKMLTNEWISSSKPIIALLKKYLKT